MGLKGFVGIMTFYEGKRKGEVAYEVTEPCDTLKEAIGRVFGMKDDKWDLTYRNKYSFYIMSLSTGKRKKLKGWKTCITKL